MTWLYCLLGIHNYLESNRSFTRGDNLSYIPRTFEGKMKTYGFTTIESKCIYCGKFHHDQVIGDQT